MIQLNIDAETAAALTAAQIFIRTREAAGRTPAQAFADLQLMVLPQDSPATAPVDVEGSLLAMNTAIGNAARTAVEVVHAVQAAIDAIPEQTDAELAKFIKSFQECSAMVQLSASETGQWLDRLAKVANAFARS